MKAMTALILFSVGAVALIANSSTKQTPSAPAPKVADASGPPKVAEVTDDECIKVLQCWAERHRTWASIKCKDEIEKLATYQAKWTEHGWYMPFPMTFAKRIGWVDQPKGTLGYRGDDVMFQNGFGAWQPQTYLCKYDPTAKEVLGVSVVPGRID